MTLYYASTDLAAGFDARAAGSLPPGWTAPAGTWQIGTTQTGLGHSHSFGATSRADGDVALLTGMAAVADMDVLMAQKLTGWGSAAPLIGPVLRADAANANHYAIVAQGSGSSAAPWIFRKTAGTYSLLSNTGLFGSAAGTTAWTNGDIMWLRARVQGGTIRLRAWKAGNPEPAGWDATATDSTLTAPGIAGLYYATNGTAQPAMAISEIQVSADGSETAAATPAATTPAAATPAPGITLRPDDAALLYTPYTWNLQPAAATAAAPGAGFRCLYTGSHSRLNFNVDAMVSPASQIWWRIDNGPWTQDSLAATIACTVPPATAANPDVAYHLLDVIVKSMTETQNRWNPGASTRVIFTGLTLAPGATAAAPLAAPLNLLIYGDSLTEGVRTLGETAADDTDRNDASLGWAHRLGSLLGAEVGLAGFGAQGLTTAGSGNVPALGASWNLLYAGAPRSFAPAPDLVILNIGTNDGSADTSGAMTALLNALIAACPATPIAVLRPFNGSQAANLQAAIAACTAPARCHDIPTAGMFAPGYGADSIALHPSGPNNIARIAPRLAAALRPLLGAASPPWFRPGFRQGLV